MMMMMMMMMEVEGPGFWLTNSEESFWGKLCLENRPCKSGKNGLAHSG